MAITHTYGSELASQREDLSDFIYNISPTETPLLQAAEWTTATAVVHSWTEDTLSDVGDNAAAQGAAKSVSAITQGTQLSNSTQISKKEYGVSGTAEVVSKAGRDSEIQYGKAKAMREIKRDMDYVIAGGPQTGSASFAKVSAASGTAPRLAPLTSWVRNASRETTGSPAGADPTAFDGTVADTQSATTRAFAQSQLDTVIEKCWNDGGRPSLLVLGGQARKDFATFDGIGTGSSANTTRTDRADKTVYGTVDVYVSSFGIDLRAVNSRNVRKEGSVARDAWLIDPEHLKVPFLRSFDIQEYAKDGDSIEEAVVAEYTLEVCNTNAHGLVADLGA